jgi:hypothetical protein
MRNDSPRNTEGLWRYEDYVNNDKAEQAQRYRDDELRALLFRAVVALETLAELTKSKE